MQYSEVQIVTCVTLNSTDKELSPMPTESQHLGTILLRDIGIYNA